MGVVSGQMGGWKFDCRLRQDIFLQTYSPAVVPVPPHMQWAKGVSGGLHWRCCEDEHTHSVEVMNELHSAGTHRIYSEH
jgi:hypothetical protein